MTHFCLSPAIALAFAAILPAAAMAKTLDDLHSAIEACGPTYWYKFDNSYANSGSAGGGPLAPVETSFGKDYYGNDASALDLNSNAAKAHSGRVDPISGGGPEANAAASAAGTLVVLFKTPASEGNDTMKRYIFRDQFGSKEHSNQLALFTTEVTEPGSSGYRLGMNFGDMNNSTVAKSLAPDTWYFFALVWQEGENAAEARVFLGQAGDAQWLQKSSVRNVSDQAVVGADGLFTFGNFSNTNKESGFFCPPSSPGQIDEFASFDRELSSEEISSIFAALAP